MREWWCNYLFAFPPAFSRSPSDTSVLVLFQARWLPVSDSPIRVLSDPPLSSCPLCRYIDPVAFSILPSGVKNAALGLSARFAVAMTVAGEKGVALALKVVILAMVEEKVSFDPGFTLSTRGQFGKI